MPNPSLAWVSPTYEGAGEGPTRLMRTTPPPTLHTARLQVEQVLGRRDQRDNITGSGKREALAPAMHMPHGGKPRVQLADGG